MSCKRKKSAGRARTAAGDRLDWRDLKILEIVQLNGSISKKALADAVGLTLGPSFQRVRRLEQLGFIRGYRGVVDGARLGSFLWVYTEVILFRHRAADFAGFENAVVGIPQVLECDAVAGGIDYVLKLIVRDVGEYQQIIDGLLDRDLGVKKYYTRIVTKRIKESQALPVAALLAPDEPG